MALLGEIRNRPWILIVMIALGLGGFLIMDMVSANQGPGGGLSQSAMGEINGEEIGRQDFETLYSQRYGNSSAPVYQNRGALWNWVVEENLIKKEAEALGLGVSMEEIIELEFGANPSPVIRSNFPNPQQPGAINTELLNQYRPVVVDHDYSIFDAAGDNAEAQKRQFIDFWRMQREMVRKDRLQSKINAVVSKGMYTPSWMAEMGHVEQSQLVDFAFVKIPYDQIANEEVALGDSDLASYLNDNRNRYERKEEMRVMDYVVFDVLPTAQDSAALIEGLQTLVAEFGTESDDSLFVLKNSGIINEQYLPVADLNAELADTINGLAVGTVYGPYADNGEFRIAKVRAKAVMADTADTRHILLSATTPADFATADERADSMMNVLRNGTANFDTLVVKFSQDPGSATNGGKYEDVTPNQFVPQYNDVLFITGQVGQLYKVRTDYGIHIVEILSRSASTTARAKVAYISEAIVPSADTQKDLYLKTSQFIAQNRDLASIKSAVDQMAGVRVTTAPALDKNAFTIGNLGYDNDTRDMVCWAFSADEGDVSPNVYTFTDKQRYYDNKYVVIGLKDIQYPGLPEVDEVRDELELAVLKESKGTMLASQVGEGASLTSLVSKFSVAIDTASNVSFSQATNPKLGAEPKVVAAAFGLEQGQTSAAIAGETGVYVLQMIRKPAASAATNLPQIRQRMNATSRNAVGNSLVRFMREGAEVSDNRVSFECNQ